MLKTRVVLCVLFSTVPAVAQLQPLAPTASTSIDVDPTSGLLSYSSITIPQGVTVRFTGTHPVIVSVQGDVRIDGELSVAAFPAGFGSGDGPGAVMTGAGTSGSFSWDPYSNTWVGSPATSGHHATLYGAAVPFDLAGGSPGGANVYIGGAFGGFTIVSGGGGGGTLVVEAGGRVDVSGRVNADGLGPAFGYASSGSGGSILLRGMLGCSIAGGGRVTAMPEGIIRLDAYDLAPQVAGTVQPSPTIMRYPDLTETIAPVLGGTWQLRVAAPRGDGVFLAASFQPGSGTNPYGTYGIDLNNAITFAVLGLPTTGHDPLATFTLPVPNAPQLIGLSLWVQGLDWYTAQLPRYTQTIATSIR
jgi:hypothetical protein